ncbi:MAG TPA: glutamate--tRNA ligase [Candidatus Dormibacteraeota bacterium]|nr:glutamate--tRNA ligase [Candidatus Dormibacteraeota bacterium]
MRPTRTRFAPSPTGALHAGAIRTALFAWLVAKHDKGQFILRIEDTDQVRNVEGAIDNIIASLKYLKLDWAEGPDISGPYGPYIQSQRLAIYHEWANKLIDMGRAYADPYTKDQLDQLRNQAKQDKKPFLFRNHRPDNPPKWDGTTPLRFKSEPKSYQWNDLVLGKLSAGPESIDDFIIIKSDGYPTYNFCHIIDDYLMEITHLIRSQEFIPSVPKFLNLYEALEIPLPFFATPPPVLNQDNDRKLSKREGAKQILDYQKMGILPEAMINMIVSLGWNDGTTDEIYSIEQLIEKFDLNRVQKSGAHFNEDKLLWLNGNYIRKMDDQKLLELATDFLPKQSKNFDDTYTRSVLALIKERLKYLSEIPMLSNFFFEDLPIDIKLIDNNKILSKISKTELIELLKIAMIELTNNDFKLGNLVDCLNQLLKKTNQQPKVLFSLIRIATTQAPASPPLAETMSLLGREKSLSRINQFIDYLVKSN